MQVKSKHNFYCINYPCVFMVAAFFFSEMCYIFTGLSMGIDFCLVCELKEDEDHETSA